MTYAKTNWIDGSTMLDSNHMNNIENGILNNDTGIATANADILSISNVINLELVHNSDWTSGSNANGSWRKDPDGLITQFGTMTITVNSSTLNFPTPFTTLTPLPAIMMTVRANTTPVAVTLAYSDQSLTQAQMRSSAATVAITWTAVGY